MVLSITNHPLLNIVFHSSGDIILRAQFQLGKDPERVGLCYIYIDHIYPYIHRSSIGHPATPPSIVKPAVEAPAMALPRPQALAVAAAVAAAASAVAAA